MACRESEAGGGPPLFQQIMARIGSGRVPLILFAFPHVRELRRLMEGRAAVVLDCPIAIEGGLEGKTDPGFNCPIATVEGELEGRTALDLDRPIEGGLEGRTDPDFVSPIATVEAEVGGGVHFWILTVPLRRKKENLGGRRFWILAV
jgi:hypothetical protein